MAEDYDVIVVGARCAGSPTAMLLARRGLRVLAVDRARFPSDTMSTHFVHVLGAAALQRWGLLDALAATGCPPVSQYAFDFGPFTISGSPRPVDGVSSSYGPRRTVLDDLLVRAAVEAGVEVREAFTVDEVLIEDGQVTGIRGYGEGGSPVTERARVVIGADGKGSAVARAVDAPRYNERPTLEAAYYAYWSGLPTERFEVYVRPDRAWGVLPTHDGLTVVVVGWPRSEFAANRADIEGNYLKTLELAPAFAERVRGARRESRFVGTGDLPGFFRRPYGPGWALVGDAGYHKDPCTAQGISDAFRDAELVTGALADWFGGSSTYDDAMADYQRARDDAVTPMFELTCQLASMEPPSAEQAQLLAATSTSQPAMDDFVSMMAGSLPVPAFFDPANVQRILGNARAVDVAS